MTANFCPRCGEPRTGTFEFCRRCGLALNPQVAADPAATLIPAPPLSSSPPPPGPPVQWVVAQDNLERAEPFEWRPDIAGDFRALPVLLRSPSFTLPTLIAIISTVIAVAVPPNSSTAAIVTLFLGPLPIGSIFIAATISPRAPYLMGGLAAVTGTIGLIVYALWAINISGETGIGPAPTDILYAVVFYGLAGVVVGGVIGLIRLPFRWLYWNLRNGGRRGG